MAHFIKTNFTRVFLIELRAFEQKKSNINIINSTFDDERRKFVDSECSSGMNLRNTKAFIADTVFPNILSQHSLMYIFSSHTIFRDCIFSKIKSNQSFLIAKSNTNASFLSCHLYSITSFGNYGAVYLKHSAGLFQNCIFESNTANGRYGNGGAISASKNSVLNIIKCFFKWNNAKRGGAVFSAQSRNVSISGCSFTENHATCEGGAIYIKGTNSTTFANNTAVEKSGAVHVSRQSVTHIFHCIFRQNKAKDGGAILSVELTSVSISHCLFVGNHAERFAGAILQYKNDLLIYATRFLRNTAVQESGAIRIMKTSVVHIFYCNFTQNKAHYGGAILTFYLGSVSISHCLFIRNHANISGGAIIHYKNDLLINATRFLSNTARQNSGAIFLMHVSAAYILHSIFTQNKAKLGGAILTHGSLRVLISHGLFIRNHAKRFAGAISSFEGINHYKNHLLVIATRFLKNTAVQDSGTIRIMETSVVHITHCIFTQNKAKYGGAMSIIDSLSVPLSIHQKQC